MKLVNAVCHFEMKATIAERYASILITNGSGRKLCNTCLVHSQAHFEYVYSKFHEFTPADVIGRIPQWNQGKNRGGILRVFDHACNHFCQVPSCLLVSLKPSTARFFPNRCLRTTSSFPPVLIECFPNGCIIFVDKRMVFLTGGSHATKRTRVRNIRENRLHTVVSMGG